MPLQCAVYGNFSAPKAQEIVVSRGKTLELLRPDDTGRVQTIFSTEVFGCIRSLAPFRLTGASRDYIIVGSDSGRIVILEYIKEQNYFKKIHQETYGKSGCRRIVPGQYLAVDPKGRACLIGEQLSLCTHIATCTWSVMLFSWGTRHRSACAKIHAAWVECSSELIYAICCCQ